MGELVELYEHRPHVVFKTINGTVHVIPLSVFRDIVDGKMEIEDLEGWREIVLTFFAEIFND